MATIVAGGPMCESGFGGLLPSGIIGLDRRWTFLSPVPTLGAITLPGGPLTFPACMFI